MTKRIGKLFCILLGLSSGLALTQEIKTPTDYETFSASPFVIFNPHEVFLDNPDFVTKDEINSYLKDLGVKWVQAMPREDVGELDIFLKAGFNVYSRAWPLPNTRGLAKMPPEYEEYLRNLIRKYGAKIKYWEADTEPEGSPIFNPDEGWGKYPEHYIEFLRQTSQIIKQECSDCKVVFGGLGGPGIEFSEDSSQVRFLKLVLDAGGGKYFDAFEFKQTYHKANDYPILKKRMDVYGKILSGYGIDIQKMPVFVETGMYDGQPVTLDVPPLPDQSESQSASSMLKTHVFGTAHGIDKILWNSLIERGPEQKRRKEIFYCYSLIHNPQNDGLSHKKLSYYTYKKMVEILEGSDWDNIRIIQESGGVYIYKLTRRGTLLRESSWRSCARFARWMCCCPQRTKPFACAW